MKILTLIATVTLVACAPAPDSWEFMPNPLDTPETTYVRPTAIGRFGPHTEFYR